VLVVEKEEPDWWTMYFDEAVNVYNNGTRVVIISPNRKKYFVLIRMQFECTNNIAENEAYILGLEAALELKIIIWRLNANNLSSERRMTNKRCHIKNICPN